MKLRRSDPFSQRCLDRIVKDVPFFIRNLELIQELDIFFLKGFPFVMIFLVHHVLYDHLYLTLCMRECCKSFMPSEGMPELSALIQEFGGVGLQISCQI